MPAHHIDDMGGTQRRFVVVRRPPHALHQCSLMRIAPPSPCLGTHIVPTILCQDPTPPLMQNLVIADVSWNRAPTCITDVKLGPSEWRRWALTFFTSATDCLVHIIIFFVWFYNTECQVRVSINQIWNTQTHLREGRKIRYLILPVIITIVLTADIDPSITSSAVEIVGSL